MNVHRSARETRWNQYYSSRHRRLIFVSIFQFVSLSADIATSFQPLLFTTKATRTVSNGASLNRRATRDGSAEPRLRLPSDLVYALDLIPVLDLVAAHCGTNRGRQALLRLVGAARADEIKSYAGARSHLSSRQHRLLSHQIDCDNNLTHDKRIAKQLAICPVATSAEEAMQAYQQVEQAARCITAVCVPPVYSADSSGPLDTTCLSITDDDDWLDFGAEHDERWTLEHVLQAEQVVTKIVAVRKWATQPQTISLALDLSATATGRIEVERLRAILSELQHTVEIVRVRTLTDASARSSYQFRLCQAKFPVLDILRNRCREMQERVDTASGGRQEQLARDVDTLRDEIAHKESSIKSGLFQAIYSAREIIDDGLNAVAKLDVIFAKAAYGCSTGAMSAVVTTGGAGGSIYVEQFVHPLLLSKRDPAVPIDLILGMESLQALIISGSNGGGKTLSMKSFGLVSIMIKLAIPIISSFPPVMDFFDNILVSVGDYQDVEGGESTFTAQLNRYASLIEQVGANSESSSLVLLDELGAGTEEAAGGVIGQAVLEKLLAAKSCRIVATTHSPRLKSLSFNSPEIGCAAPIK